MRVRAEIAEAAAEHWNTKWKESGAEVERQHDLWVEATADAAYQRRHRKWALRRLRADLSWRELHDKVCDDWHEQYSRAKQAEAEVDEAQSELVLIRADLYNVRVELVRMTESVLLERIDKEKAEAERDRWMGQFDEAEHRGLAYMEERDKLREDIANHFATEHLAGDGPEIDRWKAKCDKLAAKLKEKLLKEDKP